MTADAMPWIRVKWERYTKKVNYNTTLRTTVKFETTRYLNDVLKAPDNANQNPAFLYLNGHHGRKPLLLCFIYLFHLTWSSDLGSSINHRGIQTNAKFRSLTKIDFNVLHICSKSMQKPKIFAKNCKFVVQVTTKFLAIFSNFCPIFSNFDNII